MREFELIQLADHMRASAGFKKASIGTTPPDTSLKRLARLKDASLRPAQTLRRCHSEQSAAAATAPTDIPASSAQRSMGCGSDMEQTISTRNTKSQAKIFLGEMSSDQDTLLPFSMAKTDGAETPEIHLGDWLDFFEISITKAAKIAGVTQGYISNIIANRKPNVNVLILYKISEEMGVNVNDFYRRLPADPKLSTLKGLSPRARASILERERKKA